MTHAEYCDELFRLGINPRGIVNTQGGCLNSVGIKMSVDFFTNRAILIRNGFRCVGCGDGVMIFRK